MDSNYQHLQLGPDLDRRRTPPNRDCEVTPMNTSRMLTNTAGTSSRNSETVSSTKDKPSASLDERRPLPTSASWKTTNNLPSPQIEAADAPVYRTSWVSSMAQELTKTPLLARLSMGKLPLEDRLSLPTPENGTSQKTSVKRGTETLMNARTRRKMTDDLRKRSIYLHFRGLSRKPPRPNSSQSNSERPR